VASLALLVVAVTLSGCGSRDASSQTLALVNGQPITETMWRTALMATKVVTGTTLSPQTSAKRAEVQSLVQQQVVVDYALDHHLLTRQQGTRQASAYIERTLRPRYHGHLSLVLKNANLSATAFRAYVANQMILKDVFLWVTKSVPKVSQRAIAQYYGDHPGQFTTPTTVEVRHILVKTRRQAVALLDQIHRGASFSALATRYSLDASSAQAGGSLGFIERGQASGLLPNFYRTMDTLKPGQYGIAHTRLGYHIIEVQAVKPGSEAVLSQVQPIIAAELTTSEKASRFDAWAKKIQRAAKVKILKP